MSKLYPSIVILVILTTGCAGTSQKAIANTPITVSNVTAISPSIETPAVIRELPTWSPLAQAAMVSPPVSTTTPTNPLVTSGAAGSGIPGRMSIPPETKACDLIPQDKVETFLDEALTPPQDYDNICMLVGESESRSFTINIYRSEAAKSSFLNIIAQQKNGCTLSFSGGTNVTPTPFPPEIMQLSSKPLKELAEMVIDGYKKCDKDNSFSIVTPAVGDASFISFYDLGFIQTATLTVVSDDLYVEFTFATPSREEVRDKKDALINLVATSLAGTPAK